MAYRATLDGGHQPDLRDPVLFVRVPKVGETIHTYIFVSIKYNIQYTMYNIMMMKC